MYRNGSVFTLYKCLCRCSDAVLTAGFGPHVSPVPSLLRVESLDLRSQYRGAFTTSSEHRFERVAFAELVCLTTMAAPEDSKETRSRSDVPTLMQDNQGEDSILPTEPLPGVDFGAHIDKTDTNAASAEARDYTGSYFPSQPNDAGEHRSIRKTLTDDGPLSKLNLGPMSPKLKRLSTAPVQGRSRPKPFARTTTMLRGRKQPQDAGQYQFDESSDLSSSEDEAPVALKEEGVKEEHEGGHEHQTPQERQKAKKARSYSRFNVGNEHFKTKGKVSKRDGRLNISVNETEGTGYLAKALGHTIKHHLDVPNAKRGRKQRQHVSDHAVADVDADAESIASSLHTTATRPKLNIVIMIIGSRGDIQPFLEIGRILRHDYGHRVRIATHPTFREFVEKETDLEFFSVGGDPSELMAFMVKNPGLIPNLQTIREGEIQRRRASMKEMFEGMWRSCVNATDGETDKENQEMMESKTPFIADAIIANPPSMAHVHIAERLGIPLHIMFTFPYTPTGAFPHPLANIKAGKSNVDTSYVNFISYPLVEMMTWQGLGDIVNAFRENTLGLEPVSSLWAPGALYRMNVPYTYCWSPSLVPKPSDWGPEIDIAGFVFMDLAKEFNPPQELVDFLEAGETPIYIGFGSIVVDDPNGFTDMIFKATKMAGVRALVNKGWGGLGQSNEDTPDNIFMLENTPHDWLFPKVKAVMHHGGAGTTAIGLKCAKPTMIVPFFGDQPFWGARVAEARAGALECVPWKQMTVEKMADGIKQLLTEEAQQNVQKLADGMAREGSGAENAVKSFHRSLPLAGWHNMRCSLAGDRVAVWEVKGSSMRLSAMAVEILIKQGKIKPSGLRLIRHVEWNDFDGPGEPISGIAGATMDSLANMGAGLGMVPVRVAEHMRKRAKHERKKAAREKRKEARKEEKKHKKAEKAEEPPAAGDEPTILRRPTTHRGETDLTIASKMSADPDVPLATEVAGDVRQGLRRSGHALLTMPNDLHVAVAQGFHNAPRLWGDSTVRKPVRIVGFKTGCVAARKEFTYGIWDAWSGLITQPIGGWKDGDKIPSKAAGFGTGIGKGLGGFVLKNISAIISPPAYIGKGATVYFEKRHASDGPGSKAYIRKAQLTQGALDLEALRNQEGGSQKVKEAEEDVNAGWAVYEDIWREATKNYPVGSNLVGRYKLAKEKRRWYEAGALENAHTAQRALLVRKNGKDLGKHFAKRRQEMEIAEEPRVGAMEEPGERENELDVLPNGRRKEEARSGDENGKEAIPKAERVREEKLGAESAEDAKTPTEEKRSSESEKTVVATPDADDGHGVSSSAGLAKLPFENAGAGMDKLSKPALGRNMATA